MSATAIPGARPVADTALPAAILGLSMMQAQDGDMVPTIWQNACVLVRPAHAYSRPGIYLIRDAERPRLVRVTGSGANVAELAPDRVRVTVDSGCRPPQEMPRTAFDALALATVGAVLNVCSWDALFGEGARP